MLFSSKYFKRYCKECGNVTQIAPSVAPKSYYPVLTVCMGIIVLLILELAKLSHW